MIKGTPRFDGIALGEFSVNFMSQNVQMKAKAAFVDTALQATCGWTEQTQWQPDTMAKLGELRLLMERDIAAERFYPGAESPGAAVAAPGRPGISGGLGEHLTSADKDAEPI